METSLFVAASSLSSEEVTGLTDELCKAIQENENVSAEVSKSVASSGAKDAIAFGTIVLAFISSGAAVALFETLRSYFDRTPSLELRFEKENGDKFLLRSKHMRGPEFAKSLDAARTFFQG